MRLQRMAGKALALTLVLAARQAVAADATPGQALVPGEPGPPAPVTAVPRFVDLPATVKIEDVVIDKSELETSSDEDFVSYRIYAKVTNNGPKTMALPIFHTQLDSAPEADIQGSQASFVISPGETKVYCTGGLNTSPAILKAAKTAQFKIVWMQDLFAPAGHDRQIKFVPALSFEPSGIGIPPHSQAQVIKATLKSPAEVRLKTVQCTAALLDDAGHLLAAKPLQYIPGRGLSEFSFDTSEIDKPTRCVLIADYFSEEE